MQTTASPHTEGTPITLTAETDAGRQLLATSTGSGHGVFHEARRGAADPAPEKGAIDAQVAKDGVGLGASANQVNAAATVATTPLWVVLRKAVKPLLAILRMRLCLMGLRAQIVVLALQRPDPLSQKAQVLAQHRRRAALVDERLHFVQQRLQQFILLRVVTAANGTDAPSAQKGGVA